MGKKKHENGVTIAVKWACDKEGNWYSVIAVAKHSEIEGFSESNHSAYLKTSTVTSDCIYPNKDDATNLSARM